eukprot:1158721-Pelagomonas_calceolata.AAC.9
MRTRARMYVRERKLQEEQDLIRLIGSKPQQQDEKQIPRTSISISKHTALCLIHGLSPKESAQRSC